MMSRKCCLFHPERWCQSLQCTWAASSKTFSSSPDTNKALFYITEAAKREEMVTNSGGGFNALWRTTGINLRHINVKSPFHKKPSCCRPPSSSYEPESVQWQIPFPVTQIAWMLTSGNEAWWRCMLHSAHLPWWQCPNTFRGQKQWKQHIKHRGRLI